MNKLIVSGRPTRDPQMIYSGDGTDKKVTAKFTTATNRIYHREGEPTADFIPCVSFGRTAKIIEQYVRQGTHILITGRLVNNDYTNKDGQKVYGFQMVVESVELLDKKGSNPNDVADADGYMNADGEDVPFAQEEE